MPDAERDCTTECAGKVAEGDDTGDAHRALVEAVPDCDEVDDAGELQAHFSIRWRWSTPMKFFTFHRCPLAKEKETLTNPASNTPIKNLNTTTVA